MAKDYGKIFDFNGLEDISGTKVKIAVDKILKRESHLSKRYLTFLENNKDKEFTVELSIKWSKGNYFYTLKEDETVPKWIFAVDDFIIDNKE